MERSYRSDGFFAYAWEKNPSGLLAGSTGRKYPYGLLAGSAAK